MKYDPIPFLRESTEGWVKYSLFSTINDLTDHKLLEKYRKDVLDSSLINTAIEKGLEWETCLLKRHNDASHPIHYLEILSEFGINKEDKKVDDICKMVLAHQSEEGAFQTNILIPKTFKGTGNARWDWITCDAPILIYFLASMGYRNDRRILRAVDHIVTLVRENGLGCHSSVSKFRGPGRKDDFCPYANLLALKALSMFSTTEVKRVVSLLIKAQLDFWESRGKRKIYLFGIGTDFQKIKYPNIYYNIIHVLDVLSLFKEARESKGFKEMLTVVNDKQATDGSFKAESVWRSFKSFDFGQKKFPSPTITYKIALINSRCN